MLLLVGVAHVGIGNVHEHIRNDDVTLRLLMGRFTNSLTHGQRIEFARTLSSMEVASKDNSDNSESAMQLQNTLRLNLPSIES